MRRLFFMLMSALLLSAAGCLESFAQIGKFNPQIAKFNPWLVEEQPSYYNMRPLESMQAWEAIQIMKDEFYMYDEFPYADQPWYEDNFVFENCNRYDWTFLRNGTYRWAVKETLDGCQIEPYHHWYEPVDNWRELGLTCNTLAHLVIDFGQYYGGYVPPSPFLNDLKHDVTTGVTATSIRPGLAR